MDIEQLPQLMITYAIVGAAINYGPSYKTRAIQTYYDLTRGVRHFWFRLKLGYQAFKNADRLYGRGLIISLEFNGSFSGMGSETCRIDYIKASIMNEKGEIRKPTVYP